VVDLSSSSDEGDLIADVSRDEEFTRRLFGDLNRDVIGPSSDDNIIILSDSDKEEEDVREEKTIGTEDAATSATVNPASTASVDDASTG
jgi:tricorn protease-like protein